jgi:hypothetical protein
LTAIGQCPRTSSTSRKSATTSEGNLLVTPRVVNDADDGLARGGGLEAVAILRRVGGTIQIASQRGEIAPNVVITESYIFAYNSFTPLVRRLDAPRRRTRLSLPTTMDLRARIWTSKSSPCTSPASQRSRTSWSRRRPRNPPNLSPPPRWSSGACRIRI